MSSSGHLALLGRLLGRDYADLPGDARKSFEVALHAGSVPVLAAAAIRLGARSGEPPTPAALTLTALPAAVAGFLLERPIEDRLGGTRSVALAQIAAGGALLVADRARGARDASAPGDHLAVGLAQAVALVPGVSRSGAALTAGRLRGLSRPASLRLAVTAAVPVTLGAVALKALRAASGEAGRALSVPAVAGAGAAFASAAAASPLLNRLERPRAYTALGLYRIGVGAVSLVAARGG
ncbi:MAG: undecaprenyl-diphosphate phosphatase [Thermoleophilaceae bacterium]|nr:undecaprenyl-diphosphate phosphatase [Thermoleophilaceae bacterium]